MRVPEAVVIEQDTRAFELRKGGLTYRQIARALDCSESRAYNGVHRALKRIGTKFAEDNMDVVRLELDRLDTLMSNLWPLTMPHDSPTEDGGSVRLPPSFDAVDRVLKIMDRRAKLLGLDQVTLNITAGQNQAAIGRKAPELAEISPKDEAMKLLEVMEQAGVIAGDVLRDAKRAAGLAVIDVEAQPVPPLAELEAPEDVYGDEDPFYEGMGDGSDAPKDE